MKKKILVLFCLILVVMLFPAAVAAQDQPVTVIVNDLKLIGEEQPIVVGGTIYLPLNILTDGLPDNVRWNPETRVVTISSEPLAGDADDSPIEFSSSRFNYTLVLPADWADKVYYTEEDNGAVSFYEKTSYDACMKDGGYECGRLFSIELNEHSASGVVPTIPLTVLDGKYLEAILPSDVQWTSETKAAYDALYAQCEAVIKTFHKN